MLRCVYPVYDKSWEELKMIAENNTVLDQAVSSVKKDAEIARLKKLLEERNNTKNN